MLPFCFCAQPWMCALLSDLGPSPAELPPQALHEITPGLVPFTYTWDDEKDAARGEDCADTEETRWALIDWLQPLSQIDCTGKVSVVVQ